MTSVHGDHVRAWGDPGRLYDLIADSIPQLVWAAAPDGDADYFNSRLLAYTGMTAPQLAGQRWREIIHADDRPRVAGAWSAAAHNSERYDIECRLRRFDGAYRWHHISALPVRDYEGRVVRWFGTCTDVEEQVRSAQMLENVVEERTRALSESEARFRSLVALSSDWYWEQDRNLRFTLITGGAQRRWRIGLPIEAHLGKTRWELPALNLSEQDWAKHRAQLERRESFYDFEIQRQHPDGSVLWASISGEPVFDDAGRFTGYRGVGRDITDRRRAEQALRESEQRFQLFMDRLPASAWIRDQNFRYTYVNRRYAQTWAVEHENLLGRDAAELFPAPIAERFRETDERVAREGVPLEYIDGLPSGRWLKMKFPVPDGRGGIGVAGIALDITERSRLEAALRESEQRFRLFMQHAPAAAWIKDADFRYSYVNRTYEAVYGRAAAEVVGRDDFELHDETRARVFREEDERIRRSGQAEQKMHAVPYADGRPGHWLVVKFALEDGVGGIGIDVTPRLEAEEKARRYAEEVRTLANRLVQTQEAERRRVADGLHDLIGQNLTALGIDLQALKQRLQAGGDVVSGPRIDAMAALVETTIDAIRDVMTDLRPPALEEFGLVPALRWYASQFGKRTGMKVAVRSEGRENRLARETELALFRIAQEALTNAAKHSGGSAIDIAVSYGEALRMTITDNGRGFAEREGARAARRGGFGLPTMRERAEAIGGCLRIEFPDQGTRLVVEVP